VTGDSGHSRKSVTFERNERSRSAGTAGHVQAESAVRLARNTHSRAKHHFPQFRAAFEGEMLEQAAFVKQLQQMGRDDVDFDIPNRPCA
jgi:hypothetical protein